MVLLLEVLPHATLIVQLGLKLIDFFEDGPNNDLNFFNRFKRLFSEICFYRHSDKLVYLDTDENQKGVLLLRRVRDEAHRFALSFHRDKRSKRMNRSQLSQISGLGPSRIRELLEHFKSIDAIRIASKEDLSKVKGLGKNSVNDIYEYFNEL